VICSSVGAFYQQDPTNSTGRRAGPTRTGGIPLLTSNGSANEVRPLLAIHIGWVRVKPDVITVQVRIDLLEPARLLKDQSRIVWNSTWGTTYNGISSGPDLAAVVRSITRGQVNSFARLYVRAHTG
jgi:hypothetical protein